MAKKSVIYARVSSTNDRQNTARQVADLTTYAVGNGMEVVKTFEEHISGAKRNDERQVLCDCLTYLEEHSISMLLVSELSRLGRNVWEVQENVKRCLDNGINVYFQKEQFSLFMADGKQNPFTAIFIAVLGTCAQMERDAIYYRLNSGRQQYIANGGKVGRKSGSTESNDDILNKYPEVVKHLKRGKNSLREISAMCGVALNTTQRVKKAFKSIDNN